METENSTLYHLIKNSAGKNAKGIFCMEKDANKKWIKQSYEDWYILVEQFGMALLDMGVKKGDNVTLIMDNRKEFMVCCAAMNSLGIVDVPRGTDSTKDDLEYIFSHSEAKTAIIENKKTFDKIASSDLPNLETIILIDAEQAVYKTKTVLSYADLISKGDKIISDTNTDEFHNIGKSVLHDDPATIVYTSGTTSAPKGVLLEQNSLHFDANAVVDYTHSSPEDVVLAFLPPWHIGERILETAMIAAGGTLAYTSIATIAADLKEVNPTIFFAVPRVWEKFYQKIHENAKKGSPIKRAMFKLFVGNGKLNVTMKGVIFGNETLFKKPVFMVKLMQRLIYLLVIPPIALLDKLGQVLVFSKIRAITGSKLRIAASGAGALPYYIDIFFRAAQIKFVEIYGLTETTGSSTMRNLENPKFGTIGKPLPGIKIRLIDDEKQTISGAGQKGIAFHKGPNVMREYYKEPDKTKEVLNDGWFDSGDILQYTITGELAFAGRAKDTIVLLGGENVEPLPIEMALGTNTLFSQLMVVGQDKKSLTLLAVANPEVLKLVTAEKKISLPEDHSKWNTDKEIRKIYNSAIKDLISSAKGFKPFERITNFTIIGEEFKAGVEMTNTMKLKRNVITDNYQSVIDGMYPKV